MAQAGHLAVQRQLQRELRHIAWLEQNMPHSTQLRSARRRVLMLRTKLVVDMQQKQIWSYTITSRSSTRISSSYACCFVVSA